MEQAPGLKCKPELFQLKVTCSDWSKNISVPLFGIKMHTSNVFSKHVYKNDLNVLIEQWPNPGLVQALSVKPDHKIH